MQSAAFSVCFPALVPSSSSRAASAVRCSLKSTHRTRARIVEKLALDLPTQYKSPLAMDWSIYDASVKFDDPVTNLSGKLMYKSMIVTLALIVRWFFRKDSTDFQLLSCQLTADDAKIETVFVTQGITLWGANLVISGVDYFWLSNSENPKIIRHESTWDQSPSEIWRSFTRKTLE